MKKPVVLIVDDDQRICFAFQKTFESIHLKTISASSGEEAILRVKEARPEVVFMDIAMGGMDGLEAMRQIHQEAPELPVIIITGYGSMQTAIRAMQLGAFDYLTKPLDVKMVQITARRALEIVNMKKQISRLKSQLKKKIAYSGTQLIGQNPLMQEVYKKIGVISTTPNSSNVLILGETGTGKEVVARAIHENGPHKEEPFVAINCTVLPENLLESELFGHEKGAFTGADHLKPGKFELAKKGTLFLDEIGDMPPTLQKKLLRVIQERSFERLGGNQLIPLHARIIAATHCDLKTAIKKGEFREDLYYRLKVFQIDLPPLARRKDDIPLLANYFLAKYSEQFGKSISHISHDVIQFLSQYPFPGNVRELENIIERAVVMEKGGVLTMEALPPDLLQVPHSGSIDIPILSDDFNRAKKIIVQSFERKFLTEKLQQTGGNVSEAARISRIERQSFQRLMKKYNLSSENFKAR